MLVRPSDVSDRDDCDGRWIPLSTEHALARELQAPPRQDHNTIFFTTNTTKMKLIIVAALIASASAWTTPQHFEVPAVSLIRLR